MSSVAVLGTGRVGSLIARGLATRPEVGTLWLFDKSQRRADAEAADTAITAENHGHTRLDLKSAALDMSDESAVTEALERAAPDVVVIAATLRSWFGIAETLPAELWKPLYQRSRFGPWLPINLALPLKAMRAKTAAGVPAHVVNVSYPDVVGPVLARIGLAPSCGAGNSEIIASVVRIASARLLDRPVEDVTVRLVGHHYHLAKLDSDDAWGERAFWHRVVVDGCDVTEKLHAAGLVEATRRVCPHGSSVPVSASAIKNTVRLLTQDRDLVHCSAPGGMAGGCDVRFGPDGPVPEHPEGVDVAAITRAAEQADGIDHIDPDGTVHFGAEEARAMTEILGYERASMHPDEAGESAAELLARFDEYATRVRA